jgi:hypothetical protein
VIAKANFSERKNFSLDFCGESYKLFLAREEIGVAGGRMMQKFESVPASAGWEKIKEPTPSNWELSSGRVLQASSRPVGISGSKKRSGGAHRVQPRPFEGPSRKQGFLFAEILR